MKKYLLLLSLFGALAVTSPMMSQSTTAGDIVGTLTDPTGAAIPNAKVTVLNPATGQVKNVMTTASGAYRVSLLSPGLYKVTATAPGFTTATNTIQVGAGSTSSDDLKLTVGQGSTVVEVSAAAETVNVTNGDVSTVFSAEQVAAMPNPGNDLTFVAQTAPGSVHEHRYHRWWLR